jgi:acylphosphatase
MSLSGTIRRVTIRGHVQGVGFRAWTEHEARRRALEGWVRNRRDGAVEAVFAGPPEKVADMIEACRHGPALARVDAVEAYETHLEDLGQRRAGEAFSMLPTT